MTQHDPILRVRHMRDHAAEAIEMLGDRTLDHLRNDRMLQLALVQLIEIVGEAASRIPGSVREKYPSVPWQLAADMRNKLIHGYDVVEFAVVYDTVRDDLPPLVEQLDVVVQGN
jgi:uncharacterized protein with HEPN domain